MSTMNNTGADPSAPDIIPPVTGEQESLQPPPVQAKAPAKPAAKKPAASKPPAIAKPPKATPPPPSVGAPAALQHDYLDPALLDADENGLIVPDAPSYFVEKKFRRERITINDDEGGEHSVEKHKSFANHIFFVKEVWENDARSGLRQMKRLTQRLRLPFYTHSLDIVKRGKASGKDIIKYLLESPSTGIAFRISLVSQSHIDNEKAAQKALKLRGMKLQSDNVTGNPPPGEGYHSDYNGPASGRNAYMRGIPGGIPSDIRSIAT